jgi:hypothetical protein
MPFRIGRRRNSSVIGKSQPMPMVVLAVFHFAGTGRC